MNQRAPDGFVETFNGNLFEDYYCFLLNFESKQLQHLTHLSIISLTQMISCAKTGNDVESE